MSIVLGIDFSSHAIDIVGIHEDDLEPPTWTRYELAGQDAFDRTRTVADAMPLRYSTAYDNVIAIGIEHPAGKHGVGSMMRVQGAVLACLPAGVLVKPWPPGAWRKACGLSGSASKDEVAVWANRQLLDSPPETQRSEYRRNISLWEQDAYDSFCIALATRAALTIEAAA